MKDFYMYSVLIKKSLIIIKCAILVFSQFSVPLCKRNSVVNTHASVTSPDTVDTCKLAASMLISKHCVNKELTLSPTIYMCQSFCAKNGKL